MSKLPLSRLSRAATAVLLLGLGAFCASALATSTKPPAATTKKPVTTKRAAKKPAAPVPDAADAEQLKAAELVYLGRYECEFDQQLDVTQNARHTGYVDVQHGKATYLMKPVLSSTGAVRLEDVKGRTLMVQIGTKSMLLNVKIGQRIVDECLSPQQREIVAAVERARAAEAAAAAASAVPADAASGVPATAPGDPAAPPAANTPAAAGAASAPVTAR